MWGVSRSRPAGSGPSCALVGDDGEPSASGVAGAAGQGSDPSLHGGDPEAGETFATNPTEAPRYSLEETEAQRKYSYLSYSRINALIT